MTTRPPPSIPIGDDPIGEGLGRAIRVLRTGRDVGRRELAARAGLSYSYLAEIENGAKSPSTKALAALAAALELPVHDLVAAAEAWRTPAGSGADQPAPRPRASETSDAGLAGATLREARRAYPGEEEPEADALFDRLRSELEDRPELVFPALRAPPEAPTSARLPATRRAAPSPPPDGVSLESGSLLRLARHLERRRILWLDPHPENHAPAFAQLARAAVLSGREATALVRAVSADDALARLAEAATDDPIDLAITHWGEGAARDEAGGRVPAAQRLLAGIRVRDLRCPVIVFAADAPADEVERRKRLALGLGAQAYCFRFETLVRTIERVLAPAAETG